MSSPKILSVGQCSYDSGNLSRFARDVLGAEMVSSATHDDALTKLAGQAYDLVLVNRVGDRDGRPGLDLIRELKADPATSGVPVMLVSNYADAQEAAVEAGALPGFGKAEVGKPDVVSRVKAALAGGSTAG